MRRRDHIVLERARVAERWRTERWDSLMFQFPNWSIALPGRAYAGVDPDGFATRDDIVGFIESYAAEIAAPVRTGVNVTALRVLPGERGLEVECPSHTLRARNVVIATGPYQKPRRPPLHCLLPAGLLQIDAAGYRHPDALPEGAVLVVGSGASGCQIADELIGAGRDVILSVGRHRRVPRRYRGRDAFWWRREMGELDRPASETPLDHRLPPPLVTGVHGGYDVDLRRSAAAGLRLAGRLVGIRDGRITFADDVESSLREGDRTFAEFVAAVDAHVLASGLAVPEQGVPGPSHRVGVDGVASLEVARVSAVVWCTGYALDFGWVRAGVLDASGAPIHERGVTACPGLYFLGLSWLSKAKSSFLYGVGEDAEYIASHIALAPP
jgi:putative flavoprotein involved in K+ transport